jgi:ABC-type nickel/cobalt efflux system permease component RcnA
VVRLTPDAVVVEYHLEVDWWTIVNKDLKAVLEKVELEQLNSEKEFCDAYTRVYAPTLANLLSAKLDGQPLQFTCIRQGHKVADSIQCDFLFRAPWTLSSSRGHTVCFSEGLWLLEPARIDLSLAGDGAIEILQRTEPGESLKKRALIDLAPGDDARLRTLTASFRYHPPPPELLPEPKSDLLSPQLETPICPMVPRSLLALLLDTKRGFWMLLWLAGTLGAVHALTPGHGKTLVAAYLVGERGTTWHAVLLGLATTLTHTGIVLAVAALLPLFFSGEVPPGVETALGFFGGLLVAGLGFWLLLRRLAKQPDHVHIGGHGHHHHHDHCAADHYHDELGRSHPVGLWGLIVLGISGGIVPCPEAIVMFVFAIKAQRLWLAFPLLLAFSAGLAAVLVAIGILVVRVKGVAGSRWGESRLFRTLPLVSAMIVTGLGLWLCYDSLHSQG